MLTNPSTPILIGVNMPSPVGPLIDCEHAEHGECHIQIVLVVDLLEDKRDYRWDCYDLAGNMKERIGYTHGNIVKADGSVMKGDSIKPLGRLQRAQLNEYLAEIGVENEYN